MTETARLRIQMLAAAQAQKHVTVNEGWLLLDTLVQASVLGFATAPAGGETDGDCYIVEATATGAFAGWEGRIARRQDGEWCSFLPGTGDGAGWIAWNRDDGHLYVRDNAGDWVSLGVQLATPTEAQAGTASDRAVTPAGLRASTREKLTANRTYYVRTNGSDTNDGLVNTSGRAFLTMQKAMDTIAGLDLSIYNVTVSVAAGTYTTGLVLKTVLGSGTVSFVGDETTPLNVSIAPPGTPAVNTTSQVYGTFVVAGFRLASGNLPDVQIISPCRVTLRNNRYAGTSNFRIYGAKGAYISLSGANNQIAGGGFAMFAVDEFATIEDFGSTFTLVASVTFVLSFAFARNLAFLLSIATYTLAGYTVTGARYSASGNAIVSSAGGGASFFPGSTAGATSTGGLYV